MNTTIEWYFDMGWDELGNPVMAAYASSIENIIIKGMNRKQLEFLHNEIHAILKKYPAPQKEERRTK